MEMKRETRAFALTCKADADGMIEGYGSVFDNVDSYSDVVAKGAFKATLAAHKAAGTMPAMLWQHNASEPVGVWSEMTEDDKGLVVRGKIAMKTSKGQEAYELLKMQAVNGLSIGFYSKQWSYDESSEIRTLKEIELWEVSLVTFPANGKARVTGVKSIPDTVLSLKDAERYLRDAGFSKAEATALVGRIKSLSLSESYEGQAIADLRKLVERRNVFST